MPNWRGGIGGAASGAAAGSAFGPWGTAIGAGIGGISGLFNDPYGDASHQENQGWDQARHYQEPYWQHGNDQYDSLNQGRKDLMDPQALQDKWSSSYENSPYAKRMLQMNQQQGAEAAGAYGLGGSGASLSNIQQGAGDIVSKDRQQYMDDLMKKYMSGIGIGQDLYGKGAQAGANLGGQAMTHGENQAGIAYGQGNAMNQQFADAGSAFSNLTNQNNQNKWNANNIPAYARRPGWNQ